MSPPQRSSGPTRRQVLAGLGALAAGACGGRGTAPARSGGLPSAPLAVQSGDLDLGCARVWARALDPGRLLIEWRRVGDRDVQRVVGPWLDAGADLCGAVDLVGLPAGDISYVATIEDGRGRRSDPLAGRLRVRGPGEPLLLAWSGDVCGQGWGIEPGRGLAAFAALRQLAPDLFLHSGDAIYADGPLVEQVALPGGGVWRNLVTPGKARVAETLADFRGNFAYNLLDDHFRAFFAEVPVIAQWDDHETLNNWAPGQLLDDARYGERRLDVLAARARQAFLEYLPVRLGAGGTIHRSLRPHPEVEIVVLDARSFRAANGSGLEEAPVAMLGADQVRWLIDTVAASTATWKLIACDQPLALILADGDPVLIDGALVQRQEGFAQGAGPPLGREHEIAAILSELRARAVRNVVWLTADVHYAAAHHYAPERAVFRDFDPFWELIAGPLHAGVFGPNPLDPTFGPEIVFQRAPSDAQFGTGPWGGLMSFGSLRFDPHSRALAVTLHGGDGSVLWQTELAPSTP